MWIIVFPSVTPLQLFLLNVSVVKSEIFWSNDIFPAATHLFEPWPCDKANAGQL